MHKLGLSAPKDFCVVGYNNADASHYSDPPLSTVAQNFGYIGEWLLKSAMALSRGEVCQSGESATLDFVVRHTCNGRGKITPSLTESLRKLKLNIIQEENALPWLAEADSELADSSAA